MYLYKYSIDQYLCVKQQISLYGYTYAYVLLDGSPCTYLSSTYLRPDAEESPLSDDPREEPLQ